MDRDHATHAPDADRTALSDSGLDGWERAVLRLMRAIFADLATTPPKGAAGDDPRVLALRIFGPDLGPDMLLATSGLIRAMATERRGIFHFSNPCCRGCARQLTRDEARLVAILHQLRRNRPGNAMIEAMMLCPTGTITLVMAAAGQLLTHAPAIGADTARD